MKVLIVYAHPEPQSFNGALKDEAARFLTEQGHTVRVSDLYAMNFKAVADRSDFQGIYDQDFFRLQREQKHAHLTDSFAPDVAEELEKLLWADLLILQFPLWWFGMPAILKGWVDRVLAYETIYGGGRWYDNGVCRGKRALVSITTGGRPDRFTRDGLFGELEIILYPLRVGILNFIGIDMLEPFVVYGAANISQEERQSYLEAYRERLAEIENETPLPFRHLSGDPLPDHRAVDRA
jgi:NAD(P)H dehydrogenase (quinone)